jgi:hypothetical protein
MRERPLGDGPGVHSHPAALGPNPRVSKRPARLLPESHDRPRDCRAANSCYELPPHHVLTSRKPTKISDKNVLSS